MQSVTDFPAALDGITLRQATADDAQRCGEIFYDAFAAIAERHNFPIEPGTPEFTQFKAAQMLSHDGFAAFLAERDGDIVATAFADERGPIVGVGPVTVDPLAQDSGIGRRLVSALLERERERGVPGVRLVQTAYHYRSLSLYAKLGFVVRETLSVVQGEPPALSVAGRGVRRAVPEDLEPCADICRRVHGHERTAELGDAMAAGSAVVVERPDRISGYASGFGYGWHAVAETNEDLIALLGSAGAFIGLGILVPARNTELLRWCLDNGLRIVQQSTLMTIGLYNEPAGPYLPSILF
jgi:GNAT superfamily N-acetyltransferase